MAEPHRTLSQEDVEAIAEALEKRLVNHFYRNLGSGVWGMAWKVVVTVVIAIALYGAVKSGHVPTPLK